MRVLLLNGAKKSDQFTEKTSKKIEEFFTQNESEIEHILLRNKNVKNCQGCFKCWVQSPGQCIIKDDGIKITEDIINSELVIYLTPIIFGGYSYDLKKVLDRSIGLISPFFSTRKGEVHHKMRYSNYPILAAIGIGNENNIENNIFKDLIYRNSLNICYRNYETLVIDRNNGIDHSLKEAFNLFKKIGDNR